MAEVRSANWIELLPEPVKEGIRAQMVRRAFKDGQYIYRSGDTSTSQYQIIEGSVRLRVLSDSGKEVTYIIYGPGDCIGYTSSIDRGPRPQDAIAIGDVVANSLTASDFDQLRARHPEIDRAMTLHLTWRLREVFKQYEVGNFFGLRRRLAHQIGLLLDFAGQTPDGKPRDELELTQEMLASAVCATRQAIAKLLKEWSEQGMLEYRYGRVRVLDRQRLDAIAEQDE